MSLPSLPSRRSLASLSLVGALTIGAPAALPGLSPATADPGRPGASTAAAAGGPSRSADGVPQTSDGVRGEIAAPQTTAQRRAPVRQKTLGAWQVAPGVQARVWDERDSRGPIRAHLLTVDWSTPGLSLDYADTGRVARVDTVRNILARDRTAVAGVNGDFFDIGVTGAPLGLGRDRTHGLLHGPRGGWNSAFFVGGNGRPQIGEVTVRTTAAERPGLRFTNLNSPVVKPGGIGVYTAQWGDTQGYRVTDGQTSKVRMVQVRHGQVVRNSVALPSGTPVVGRMLVGRGAGATSLVSLKPGTRLTVRSRPDKSPRMAITGNKVLLAKGAQQVVDDREMHPRTAIGVDREAKKILILVIDGRQSFSRGYTMVELAKKMRALGADDALNLDGGGSSTMLAQRDGSMTKVNSPSDGFERRVANAVEVSYRAP